MSRHRPRVARLGPGQLDRVRLQRGQEDRDGETPEGDRGALQRPAKQGVLPVVDRVQLPRRRPLRRERLQGRPHPGGHPLPDRPRF